MRTEKERRDLDRTAAFPALEDSVRFVGLIRQVQTQMTVSPKAVALKYLIIIKLICSHTTDASGVQCFLFLQPRPARSFHPSMLNGLDLDYVAHVAAQDWWALGWTSHDLKVNHVSILSKVADIRNLCFTRGSSALPIDVLLSGARS
jgi:hypothetical protein